MPLPNDPPAAQVSCITTSSGGGTWNGSRYASVAGIVNCAGTPLAIGCVRRRTVTTLGLPSPRQPGKTHSGRSTRTRCTPCDSRKAQIRGCHHGIVSRHETAGRRHEIELHSPPRIAPARLFPRYLVHRRYKRDRPMRGTRVARLARFFPCLDPLDYARADLLGNLAFPPDVSPPDDDVAGLERVTSETVLGIVESDGFRDGDAGQSPEVVGNTVADESGYASFCCGCRSSHTSTGMFCALERACHSE